MSLKVTDRSIIKAMEVHTIMASEGYVVLNGLTRVISISPNHVSMFSLKAPVGVHGVFGNSFQIVRNDRFSSPYWKAKNFLMLEVEKEDLIVKTDYGVGITCPVAYRPTIPSPPNNVRKVNVHREKVWLAKVLGVKNFKRPSPSERYVKVFSRGGKFCFSASGSEFCHVGYGGGVGEVKASTLLQVLEVAWRVNKRGFFGVVDDKLYFSTAGECCYYEAFVQIV